MDGAFSWTKFLDFLSIFSIGFRPWPYNWFYMPFLKKKNLNSFCSVTRSLIVLKNDFIINKPIFDRLTVENFPDFKCVYCLSSNCHFHWFFKWQPHIMISFGDSLVFFKQTLYILFEQHQIKLQALSLWLIQILDLSLNITFFQLFTTSWLFLLSIL